MDNDILKQRAFILSSLRRLNISISTYAYKFADKMIKEGWMPSLGDLKQVDQEIEIKFREFMNEQR
jgi:hypothetical protein